MAICQLFACGPQAPNDKPLKVAINAGPEGEAIKKLVAQGYPAAKIEIVELPYQSLREQLITVLNATQPSFDVVMIDDPWFPQLAPKVRELREVPQSLINDIVPASLSLGRDPYPNGKLKGLPFVGNTQVLFYRRDILERLGNTTPPASWGELASLASSVERQSEARLGKKVYGYAIRGKSGAPVVTDFLPIYWSLGGKLTDDIGAPRKQAVDKAKLIEALAIYTRLQQASPPGASNYDWSEMTQDFTNGRAVMELNWPAAIPIIDAGIQKNGGKSSDWAIALPPRGEGAVGTSMIGNWLLAVPVTSSRPKEAAHFMVWLLDNQGIVATSGNPPTRISVFAELAKTPGNEYFAVIRQALEHSTARDRTPLWAQIEDAVSRGVSGYLSGTLNEQAAANLITEDIGKLF
jgi:multiple sugar transport system substrate-binding protein